MKNVILVVSAFALGISAAFASLMTPEDVYVRARFVPSGPIHCVNTLAQCDRTGTNLCTVIIYTEQGGYRPVSCSVSNAWPFRAGCVELLCNDTYFGSHYSPITVYELSF